VGAYDDALRPILARTLASLGTQHAWIVRGTDGLDEISPFGVTRVTELAGGKINERLISPEDFGVANAAPGALDGGDARSNAARIAAILAGGDDPARSAAILNAAAAIAIARETTDGNGLREAAATATFQLDSGGGLRTLEAWRAAASEKA
jgi:anthranilate phosphoribosyltransferase